MTVKANMANPEIQKKAYDELIASLKANKFKTTSITDPREANFLDYGNGLGSNVQKMVLDSFGSNKAEAAADKKLQDKLSKFWKKDNVSFMKPEELKKFCDANGIEMSVTYVKTQHIVDNKLSSKYDNNKTNATGGSVAVYSFKDKNDKNGAIKVADANGNGGLEIEELFMNDYLTGITADIAKMSTEDIIKDPGITKADKSKLVDNSIIKYEADKYDKDKDSNKNELTLNQDKYEKIAPEIKYELGKDKFIEMMKTLMLVNNYTKETALETLKSQYSFLNFNPEDVEIDLKNK